MYVADEISTMKIRFEHIASIVLMMGAVRSKVTAAFSKREYGNPKQDRCLMVLELSCLDYLAPGAKPSQTYNIDKDVCISGQGGSLSIQFTKVKKNRSLCLKKYYGDQCDGGGYAQTLLFVPEGEYCILPISSWCFKLKQLRSALSANCW
jgi:hypothetical protein